MSAQPAQSPETHEIWSRLDQILSRLSASDLWSLDNEIKFLEALTAVPDRDLADLARNKLSILRTRH